MEYDNIINEIVHYYKAVLGDNLVGIYLHGSYTMGGFNPDVSDIDFMVVVYDDIKDDDKKKLIKKLLDLDDISPVKGFEMSVMRLDDTICPKKPTKFLLHYSNFHKEVYQNDCNYICSGDDDPDLLAHITVIKARGECRYGKSIDEVFGDVPSSYYIDAIMYDLNDARKGMQSQLDYYVLNICRSLYYFREGVIASKYEGGKWAMKNLSNKYLNLIEGALNIHSSNIKSIEISNDVLNNFIEDSFIEINSYLR